MRMAAWSLTLFFIPGYSLSDRNMIWTDRGIGRKDWKLLLERKSLAGPLRQSRARPNKLLHKSPSTYHQIRVILSRKSRK